MSDTTVFVLPTAGVNRRDPDLPDRAGRMRIREFARSLREHPQARGVILGGLPDQRGQTLGTKYFRYLQSRYPEVCCQIGFIHDQGGCTVQDILLAAEPLRQLSQGDRQPVLAFVTSRSHYRRIQPTVSHLGMRPALAPSGEAVSLAGELLGRVLGSFTQLDPTWDSWIGKRLRATGSKRKPAPGG